MNVTIYESPDYGLPGIGLRISCILDAGLDRDIYYFGVSDQTHSVTCVANLPTAARGIWWLEKEVPFDHLYSSGGEHIRVTHDCATIRIKISGLHSSNDYFQTVFEVHVSESIYNAFECLHKLIGSPAAKSAESEIAESDFANADADANAIANANAIADANEIADAISHASHFGGGLSCAGGRSIVSARSDEPRAFATIVFGRAIGKDTWRGALKSYSSQIGDVFVLSRGACGDYPQTMSIVMRGRYVESICEAYAIFPTSDIMREIAAGIKPASRSC